MSGVHISASRRRRPSPPCGARLHLAGRQASAWQKYNRDSRREDNDDVREDRE